MLSASKLRIHMPNEHLPLVLTYRDKVQSAVVGFCRRSKMERGASGSDIHCSPKDITARNIFSIDAHLPTMGRIIERQLPQKRQVCCEFFLRRSSFFFVGLRGGKVVSKQPAAGCF